jgi:hypothetical protein
MKINCSPETEVLIQEFGRLLAEFKYPQAKTLMQDALRSCYEQSAISLDIAQLLDELAIACRDLEQFEEASMYLAQSLAIKKLLFGPGHIETATAKSRLQAVSNYPKRHFAAGEISQLSRGAEDQKASTGRAVRCLVIAKHPEETYFGRQYQGSGYVVVCEDGQIACLYGELAQSAEIELGQEIEAYPFRVVFGRLLLTLHPAFVAKKETPVVDWNPKYHLDRSAQAKPPLQ